MRAHIAASLILVALISIGAPLAHADVDNASSTNVQEGDNDNRSDQSGESSSGDAVGGQVVGVTSSGDASVHATNRTEDSSATSGDASGSNASQAVTGLVVGSVDLSAADVASGASTNVQEGDNAAEQRQAVFVTSGDAVAGQVAGLVTTDGGSADLVLSNVTEDADAESGDAIFENAAASLTGLFEVGSGGLSLNIADARAREGTPLRFRVTLTSGRAASADTATVQDGVTFQVTTQTGSAGATDFEPVTGTFSIQPGGSTTITVNTLEDQPCEPSEQMQMRITSAQGASIGDGTATGEIFQVDC